MEIKNRTSILSRIWKKSKTEIDKKISEVLEGLIQIIENDNIPGEYFEDDFYYMSREVFYQLEKKEKTDKNTKLKEELEKLEKEIKNLIFKVNNIYWKEYLDSEDAEEDLIKIKKLMDEFEAIAKENKLFSETYEKGIYSTEQFNSREDFFEERNKKRFKKENQIK